MLLLPVMALTFAVTACGDDDSSSDASSTATTTVAVPDIVGKSVDEATATLESAGLTLRVLKRDGEDLAGTADYLPTRVNVAVETQADGTEKVTEVISVG
jgi:beta-lactam-binding protein with PASTA domain